MKSRKMSLLLVMAAAVLGAPRLGEAKVLTLSPTQVAALPAESLRQARAAVQFDLSALPDAAKIRIDSAVFQCPVPEASSSEETEFQVFPLENAWSVNAVGAGRYPEASATEATAWAITPLDYEREGGGFLRLFLDDLVQGWVRGTTANHRFVVATDLPSTGLVNTLSAGTLTIRWVYKER